MERANIPMYSDDSPTFLKLKSQSHTSFYNLLSHHHYRQIKNFIYFQGHQRDHHFLYADDNKNFIFIKSQTRRETLKPDLNRVRFAVNDLVYDSRKWDVPIPLKFYIGKKSNANCLSWRYIDFMLHSYPGVMTDAKYRSESVEFEDLFRKIQQEGLEGSVIRLLACKNDQLLYMEEFDKVFTCMAW